MHTYKDIAAIDPGTATVSGFAYFIFKVKFKRYPFLKTTFEKDWDKILWISRVDFAIYVVKAVLFNFVLLLASIL